MRFSCYFARVRSHAMRPPVMTNYTSSLLRLLDQRGTIHQITDSERLDALAANSAIAAYIGFDATAPSLHVGSLVPIMLLRRLQQTGHKPIVVMGGGTTKIGDPSGKDIARQMLTPEKINQNIASIRRVFEQFLNFGDAPSQAVMINNAEWLDQLGYVEFLRSVGAHFTINRMLTFDSVKLRLERKQPLTFLEFNYMVLQAYDFRELARTHNVRLQMGGSDQWGNIVNGIELARRMDGNNVFGLTSPLLTTADGAKMGKTANGAVWLNADQTTHFDYWQYWRNVDDRDVSRFLRLFTELPLGEIEQLEALGGSEINAAKKALANAATALCRGSDAAINAENTAEQAFAIGSSTKTHLSGDLPRVTLDAPVTLIEALRKLKFAASNKEARRKLAEGAVKVDGEVIHDPFYRLCPSSAPVAVSLGSKRYGMIHFDGS